MWERRGRTVEEEESAEKATAKSRWLTPPIRPSSALSRNLTPGRTVDHTESWKRWLERVERERGEVREKKREKENEVER